jgi:Flp pilus assembly protein TadG
MRLFSQKTLKRLMLQNPLHREQGQAAVEFALTMLITLTLVFGLIEFSRAIYASSVVQAAAQSGARAGIIDVTEITTAVEEKLVGLDIEKANISYTEPAFRTIEVEVVYQFEFIVPLIETITGGDIELRGTASMVGQ